MIVRMNMHTREDPARLAADLLDRLRPLFSAPLQAGVQPRGAGVFSYCALDYERILAARLEHPVVGILLQGKKEIWVGETCRPLAPGDVFVLPGGVDFDAVNIPDPRRGIYETLLLEVRVRPASVPPQPPKVEPRFEITVPLNPALVDSIAHAALSLAGSPHAQRLAELRLAEMLIQLGDVPAARPLFATGLAERIRWIVLTAPDRAWTGDALARMLGLGGSTLRRRLAAEGSSLRAIVRDARLQVARDLLADAQSVGGAAAAAGYVSRSHFARLYRRRFGVLPSRSQATAANRHGDAP